LTGIVGDSAVAALLGRGKSTEIAAKLSFAIR
jgi:hypothetical protein